MPDEKKAEEESPSILKEAVKQITGPRDWAFGALGAAAGASVTLVTSGTDAGTSIGAGFFSGVMLSKVITHEQFDTKLDVLTDEYRELDKEVRKLKVGTVPP